VKKQKEYSIKGNPSIKYKLFIIKYIENILSFYFNIKMLNTNINKSSFYGIGAPENYQLSFQLPASPIAEGIFTFHDDLIRFLIGILFFVLSIIISAFSLGEKGSNSNVIFSSVRVVHASTLEIV